MTKIRTSLVAGAAAVAVALTGCGGGAKRNGIEKKAPQQIKQQSIDTLKTATSVHVVGSGTSAGSQIHFDMHLVKTASSGTITEGGQTIQIVVVGSEVYLKGGPTFLESLTGSAATAKAIGDRWVKVPASGTGQLGTFTLTGLTADANTASAAGAAVTTTKLGSAEAVLVAEKAGYKMYVADTGKPYPLQTQTTGDDALTTTFSDYDQPLSITAPAGAVDGSTFG